MTIQGETLVKRRIRAALMATGRVRIFPNPRGFDREFKRWYGLADGAADLVGLLRSGQERGRFVAFEVKTHAAGSRPRKTQLAHADMIRADGGFYAFVRDEVEALAALARAECGESE